MAEEYFATLPPIGQEHLATLPGDREPLPRFVKIDGVYINMSQVRGFRMKGGDTLILYIHGATCLVTWSIDRVATVLNGYPDPG